MPGYSMNLCEDLLAKKTEQRGSKNTVNRQSSPVLYLGIGIIAILVVIALIQLGRPASPTATGVNIGVMGEAERGLTDDGLPYLGNRDAPIVIVQYEDFGCHNCKTFAESIEPKLVEQYVLDGSVLLINHPVAFVNQQSRPAAEAAECALKQDKFWDYRHILFQNLGVVPFNRDNLVNFASQAGLDTRTFSSCYDQKLYETLVVDRTLASQRRGVTGTPTFDINGTLYQGVMPVDSTNPERPGFKQIIERIQAGER
jgi:protein-disulfide isomerase